MKALSDVLEIKKAYPAGTRLRSLRDGGVYQIGLKRGILEFWLLREKDQQRVAVPAAEILRDFERVP